MSRTRINLNREWRFHRGGDVEGAERADFDDSSWQPIGLPHCFDLPYFRTPEFYVGYGWYRKTLDMSPECRDRRLFLEFDGVFQVAEVFVNGARVGEHRGGYTGFSLEITDSARPGANVLAVRVNNLWNPQLAPRAGEHIFSGGIYRDVYLLIAHRLHFAARGTVITTPSVSTGSATVAVETEVEHTPATKSYRIRTAIADPGGNVVATSDDACFQRVIPNPRLWHPDLPQLYRLHQTLFVEDMVVDELITSFGIRSFRWTADRGFFLNGEHLYLRGVNAHQDHAGWGIGITRAACERDVRLIKEAGFNFVRGSHYPHHPAFADACDRLGLLFWAENCFWGKGGFGPEGYWNASAYPPNAEDFEPFERHCKQTLQEMIRQNRNHPSIIAWSMCNEPFFTYNLGRAKSLLRDLVNLSHQLDPTRPAAIGGAQRGDIDQLGDVAGYNGDGARLFIDPGMPNMVSEYGATAKPHDAHEPFFGDLQPEQFPWRAGQAIWCGFDYGSISGKQGLKGIVDHFRIPKRSWHWYRNKYRGIAPPSQPVPDGPVRLELNSDKTTIRGTDATDDCQLIITVLDANDRHVSASPSITLTIESGPGEFPTGRSITFAPDSDIQIINGQCAIAFRSYHGGRSVIRATSPGLRDATITFTTEGEPAYVEGTTPLVPDRPYHPPPPSQAAIDALRNAINVALNRPSRASSHIELHPARLANDGDAHTAWESDDPSAWWLVDLEGFYQLASLRLTFVCEGNFRFVVETSNDARDWTMAIDRRETQNGRMQRNDIFPPGATARYVRVRFADVPQGARANLAEVEIDGVPSVH